MSAINFKANPITSQKLVAEKMAKLKEYEISKSLVKNNTKKLQQHIKDKLPLAILKDSSSKKTVEEKAVIDDLLFNLEDQIALEPRNIELRKAYESIKSQL